jgi:hypothetical protein
VTGASCTVCGKTVHQWEEDEVHDHFDCDYEHPICSEPVLADAQVPPAGGAIRAEGASNLSIANILANVLNKFVPVPASLYDMPRNTRETADTLRMTSSRKSRTVWPVIPRRFRRAASRSGHLPQTRLC